MALRIGEKPSRLTLQSLLDQAMEGRPATSEFFSRLELEGVLVIPNLASTGKVSGLAYSYQGILWKGSDLGKKYSWNALIAGGIDYDQVRDAPVIARKKAQTILGNDGGILANADTDRRAVNGAEQSTGGSERNIESGNGIVTDTKHSGYAPRDDSKGNPAIEGEGERKRIGAEFGIEDGRQCGDLDAKTGGSDEGGSGDFRRSSKTDQTGWNLENSAGSSVLIAHHSVDSNGGKRIQAGSKTANSARQQNSGRTNRSQLAEKSVGVVSAIKRQLTAWADFQKHLCCKLFRIAWVDRDDGRTRPKQEGGKPGRGASCTPLPLRGKQDKSAKEQSGEHLWSFEEVATDIASGRFNVENYNQNKDMYVRPFDPEHHFVFIDDVKGRNGVRELLLDGYLPALVQESSHENFQVILKIRGDGMCEANSVERIAINRQALTLNQKYGDPGAGRGIQNFRIPGFLNKKFGRDDFLVRINYEFSTPESVCEKGSKELDDWREFVTMEQLQIEQQGIQARVEQQFLKLQNAASSPDVQKFASIYTKWVAIKRKAGAEINLSEVDFQVAKELLKIEKWDPERVGEVMLAASPDIENRKKTWTLGYISKTVAAAKNAVIKACSDQQMMSQSRPASNVSPITQSPNYPGFSK